MRRCKVQDFYRKVIVFDVLINIHEGVKNIYEALENKILTDQITMVTCISIAYMYIFR